MPSGLSNVTMVYLIQLKDKWYPEMEVYWLRNVTCPKSSWTMESTVLDLFMVQLSQKLGQRRFGSIEECRSLILGQLTLLSYRHRFWNSSSPQRHNKLLAALLTKPKLSPLRQKVRWSISVAFYQEQISQSRLWSMMIRQHCRFCLISWKLRWK